MQRAGRGSFKKQAKNRKLSEKIGKMREKGKRGKYQAKGNSFNVQNG